MRFHAILDRLPMFVLTASICIGLAALWGAWPAIALWAVGMMAFRLITVVATGAKSGMRFSGVRAPILSLLALIAASVALTIFGQTAALTLISLILAGGPIVFIAACFSFVLLTALMRGRHARWN